MKLHKTNSKPLTVKSTPILLFLFSVLITLGCIGDDFIDDAVDPVIQITNKIDTIAFNESFQFEATYLNNVGVPEDVPFEWSSSSPNIISISQNGLATGLEEGSSRISVNYQDGVVLLKDEITVHVGEETVVSTTERSGSIRTTSSYTLRGDFVLSKDGDGVKLDFSDNYSASSNLPGLYVYLTNNPNSIADAHEIGAVSVFSGAHSYSVDTVGLNDFNYLLYFCKPFNVKVGDGEMN